MPAVKVWRPGGSFGYLSLRHHTDFYSLDGLRFTTIEQFVAWCKARYFIRERVAADIAAESDLQKIKLLERDLPDVVLPYDQLRCFVCEGYRLKLRQNEHLLHEFKALKNPVFKCVDDRTDFAEAVVDALTCLHRDL